MARISAESLVVVAALALAIVSLSHHGPAAQPLFAWGEKDLARLLAIAVPFAAAVAFLASH